MIRPTLMPRMARRSNSTQMSSTKKQPAPATTYSSKPVVAIARVLRMRLRGRKKRLVTIISRAGGGVTSDEINSMELSLKELETANVDIDRLREELTPKVKHMNEVLTRVKEAYADKKKTLKGYYPQERWADYGIPDKR